MKKQAAEENIASNQSTGIRTPSTRSLHLATVLTALGASLGLNPDTLLATPLDPSIVSFKMDSVSFKFFKMEDSLPIELTWNVDAVQLKIDDKYPSYLPLSVAANPGIAVQFNLTETTNLTGMLGNFLVPNNVDGFGYGGMLAAIYADSSGAPGEELLSSVFQVTSSGPGGVTGLDFSLSPGAYWAVFELPAGSSFSGFLVPEIGSQSFSMRLLTSGGTTAVPEPGSLILLATGMAAAIGYRMTKRGKNG